MCEKVKTLYLLLDKYDDVHKFQSCQALNQIYSLLDSFIKSK